MQINWDDYRLLLAVERASSFHHAGRALGVATSTVARRIAALEQQQGVPLVRREPHGVSFTAHGRKLVEVAVDVEARLIAADRETGDIDGHVSVATGEGFVAPVVDALVALQQRLPALRFMVTAENDTKNLAKRQADVAVRTTKEERPSVVSRRVGDLHYGLYATRTYLRRFGGVTALESLAQHRFVAASHPFAEVRWLEQHGVRDFALRCSTADGVARATVAGIGIGALPCALVDRHPELLRLLPRASLPSKPVYVAYRSDRRREPKMRAVVHALTEAMQSILRPSAVADDALKRG